MKKKKMLSHQENESFFGHSDDHPKVKEFILEQKGKVFVDVGANTGFYALNLADSFERIYAYEPYRGSSRYMKRIKQLHKLNNVEIREIALGNKIEMKKFFLSPRGAKCHSLLPVGKVTIKVPCSTLTKEFDKTEIDLVKVDTEGNEFEVLEGAKAIIKYIKAWIIEIHDLREICGSFAVVKGNFLDRCKEMENLLKKLKYKTKWIRKNKVIYAWRE